jgi:hypothetical protein
MNMQRYLGREAGWKAESGWEAIAVGWVKWPRLDLQKLPTLTKRLVDGGDLMGMVTAQITSLSLSPFIVWLILPWSITTPKKQKQLIG